MQAEDVSGFCKEVRHQRQIDRGRLGLRIAAYEWRQKRSTILLGDPRLEARFSDYLTQEVRAEAEKHNAPELADTLRRRALEKIAAMPADQRPYNYQEAIGAAFQEEILKFLDILD